MIQLEKLLELSVRNALRIAIDAAASGTAELQDARIVAFWNDAEDGTWAGNDASGLRVMITTHPSSSEGYQPGVGFMPQRSVMMDIACTSQPDSDRTRAVLCALYQAVRATFEASALSFTMPSGVIFGGMLITSGGAGSFEDLGQAITFTVDFRVSVT
jgi:hypothetical protein